jgi:hypothetical protein
VLIPSISLHEKKICQTKKNIHITKESGMPIAVISDSLNKPDLTILYMLRPVGFLAPKDFKIIWFSNPLALSVHVTDEGYSRNASCTIN